MWTQNYTGLFIYYMKKISFENFALYIKYKKIEYCKYIISYFKNIFSKLLTILPDKNLNNYITEEFPNTSHFLIFQAIIKRITLIKTYSSFVK